MEDRNKKGQFKKGHLHPPERKVLDLKLLKEKYLSGKSTIDLSKYFKISDRTLASRLKELGILRTRNESLKVASKKISRTLKRKGIQPTQRFSGKVWNKDLTQADERVKNNIKGLLENRKYQVLPTKDSSIEVKLQNLLKELKIKFIAHKHIKIKHGYQADIFIPKLNLIIEAYGTYWHHYPTSRPIDIIRCNELKERGYKVLILWENEIKVMTLEDMKNELSKFTL